MSAEEPKRDAFGRDVTDQPGAPLPPGVTDTFTHLCHICGGTVHVAAGLTQPHPCRIVVDAEPR